MIRARSIFGATAVVTIACAIVIACGSSDDAAPASADAGAVDVAVDTFVRPRPDVARPEAAPECSPQPVDPASLPWVPPHAAQPSACSAQQIGGWYDVCWGGSSTSQACTAFEGDPANAACLGCIFYQPNAPARGAAVIANHYLRLNLSGCVALLTGDASATSCAAKVQKHYDCLPASCLPLCPTDTSTQQTRYEECQSAAFDSTCKAFVDAENGCASLPGLAVCRATKYPDFRSALVGVGSIFCGGYPSDGGADGGGDAATD